MKYLKARMIVAIAAGMAFVAPAFAQTTPIPTVSSVSSADYVQVIPNGQISVGNKYATVGTLFGGGTALNVPILSSYTTTAAAPGTVRDIYGKISIGAGITMTSGNLVGTRGEVNVPSGTTTSAAGDYLYGVQGKFIGGGTITQANICGVCAQIDASAGTYTAGVVSGLWIDMGSSASASAQSTSFGGASQLLRMTNTTNAGAAKTTSIMDIYANSPLFLTLGGPGGTVDYFLAAGTGGSSCGVSTGAVAAKVLAITVGGTPYYIPLCSSNS